MISNREVRKARSFLYTRGITAREISPRRFAAAAKELDTSFGELLRMIAQLKMGGQGSDIARRESIRQLTTR